MSAPPVRLGTFLLASSIGEGGMGTVFRARHPEGVEVAVKVLRPDYGGSLLEAFRAEVRSVAALDHPNVVRVLDYGVVPEATAAASQGAVPRGSPWLAMELADLGTLGDRAAFTSFDELAHVVLQLLDGLGHAHARGLVHRDLKPRNVLLFTGSRRPRAALTDFGIAHLVGRVDPNAAQAGTPGYMAPEQIRGERRALGPWTDLYALGCVVHRMATGRPPFSGPSKFHVLKAHLTSDPPRIKPAFPVPDGFEDFFRVLMARDPLQRPQSAAVAAAALRALSGHTAPAEDWQPRYRATTERPRGTGLGLFLLRPWPLVGRAEVQAALWARLQLARARRATPVAWLEGSPGLGRTRLVTWLAQRAEETGVAEVWTFPPEASVARRLRTLLRVDGLPEAEARAWLSGWLAREGHGASADPGAALAALTSEEPLPQDLLRRLFSGPGVRSAALVVFDDVHLANPAVHQLLVDLAALQAEPGSRLLVLVTSVAGAALPPAVDAVRGRASRVELGPLDDDDRHRLVRFPGLSERLARAVVDRTGGNPWFVVRMVTEWARAGGLVPTSHGYELRPGFEAALPDELVDHCLGQVATATSSLPGAASALELLALLGGAGVREDEWRAACLRTGAPWHPGRVAATGVVATSRTGRTVRWSFVDPIVGEALLQVATREGRRRQLHLAVAECLLGIPRAGAQERATVHLAAAGHVDRALDGLRAMVDEAFHHDRLDRVDAFLQQEASLLHADRAPEDDARRLLHELDTLRAALARGRPTAPGTVLARGVRSPSALVRARAAVVELQLVGAPAEDPRWEGCRRDLQAAGDGRSWRRLLRWRLRWRSTHGEVEGALADARAGREDAARASDPLDEERFEGLELTMLILHRHPAARDALAQARTRATTRGQAELAARWLAWSSAVLRARGDRAGAARAAERAREELTALGCRRPWRWCSSASWRSTTRRSATRAGGSGASWARPPPRRTWRSWRAPGCSSPPRTRSSGTCGRRRWVTSRRRCPRPTIRARSRRSIRTWRPPSIWRP
jgi:hypothetical protein